MAEFWRNNFCGCICCDSGRTERRNAEGAKERDETAEKSNVDVRVPAARN
jgi:predicted adenine nucleotide alpha hydrolase (AANH) superfamily ATPase